MAPIVDIQIFQNISCWRPIKLTPTSQAARTCTGVLFVCEHPELMLPLGLQSAAQSGLGQNNILWQKQAKEDVETHRDLTGSRPAIHSFSARLRVNTSLQIKCLSKSPTRAESSLTTGTDKSNCELFEANEWFHLFPSATSLYYALSDDTQRGTFQFWQGKEIFSSKHTSIFGSNKVKLLLQRSSLWLDFYFYFF